MKLRRGSSAGQGGFSIVELMMVCALLVILAAIALPTTRYAVRRQKEMELRGSLRSLRNAIDEYKRFSDAGLIPIELGSDGYPPELEVLVEGIDLVGQVDYRMRFLRRIPLDPMTGEAEWGLLGYQDEPDSDSWSGDNVFDVYSLSDGVGINGIPYREW